MISQEQYAGGAPPVTGPGQVAVFTYRDQRGEEVMLTVNSGPGLPPVEFQGMNELRRIGVPLESVTAVHTDLRPSMLPGGYTARTAREAFPSAEFSCAHGYGEFKQDRDEGVASLLQQAETMARLAGQEPPPRPNRAPLPEAPRPDTSLDDEEVGRELRRVFGEQGVRRYSPDELAATPLPAAVRALLATAGIPAMVPYFFAAAHPLTSAADVMREQGTEAADSAMATLAEHVRIGGDGYALITVQCGGSERWRGSVWAADPRTGTGRFVNASTPAFIRSLALLTVSRAAMPGLDPAQSGAAVARFQQELASIDHYALDEDNWWATILDQMWHALL